MTPPATSLKDLNKDSYCKLTDKALWQSGLMRCPAIQAD